VVAPPESCKNTQSVFLPSDVLHSTDKECENKAADNLLVPLDSQSNSTFVIKKNDYASTTIYFYVSWGHESGPKATKANKFFYRGT